VSVKQQAVASPCGQNNGYVTNREAAKREITVASDLPTTATDTSNAMMPFLQPIGLLFRYVHFNTT
jgi:hypothetical protein